MKNKIRQILREETSGFDPKELKALYQFMNFLTKDYVWYHDTPEQRFGWTPESIWLINPETKKWVIVLQKGGKLWWSIDFYHNFKRYFNMERPDFESFITIWVEDVLNRGVSSTVSRRYWKFPSVEDVLNRGVSSTDWAEPSWLRGVEDVLNRGVSSTREAFLLAADRVEDVLKNGEELK